MRACSILREHTPAALSYVCGAGDAPLLGQTLGGALSSAAARWTSRPALVSHSHGAVWSWAELEERANELAAGLLAVGCAKGDRIGIWALNRPEWVLTQFAAAKAGLILVTINPAYKLREVEYALNKVGVAALVTATRFKNSDYVGMLRSLAPELETCTPGALSAARLPSLRAVIQLGVGDRGGGPSAPARGMFAFDDVARRGGAVERARLAELRDELQFDDVANIQYTSGTTGAPKGVMLSHHAILNNGASVGASMRLTHEDAICLPVPLYHCFGSVMGSLTAVTHGASVVLPGEGFDALATLQAIERDRCTALYGVPTMYIAQLEHPDFQRFDLRSLRTGIMSGAPCPIELARALVSRMHLKDLTIAYGMTETAPVSFQSTPEDALERRVTSVGRVLPHVEAKVVDRQGRVVPRGARGELCTRGYGVMRGYWGDAAQTAAAIDDAGWMHSGDFATIDVDGYANIVGRLKDVVIRGGENVYPREIEEFLLSSHPAILDAQVFGVADARYGEELCVWVRVREGHVLTGDEVRAHCRASIAHQKVPRYVEIVDGFPLTTSGKPQKYLMRAAVEERLGLKAPATA